MRKEYSENPALTVHTEGKKKVSSSQTSKLLRMVGRNGYVKDSEKMNVTKSYKAVESRNSPHPEEKWQKVDDYENDYY